MCAAWGVEFMPSFSIGSLLTTSVIIGLSTAIFGVTTSVIGQTVPEYGQMINETAPDQLLVEVNETVTQGYRPPQKF